MDQLQLPDGEIEGVEVRQREVKHTRGRLGELSCTQENAIESLSRRIIDQILNTPIAVFKRSL